MEVIGVIILIAIYLIPTIIVYSRNHAYRHVIMALNIFGGITGILWLVAIVWALWPTERSLADPLVGNPTGLGVRNSGDSFGSLSAGVSRGEQSEVTLTSQIVRLADLRDKGLISPNEYDSLKAKAIEDSFR